MKLICKRCEATIPNSNINLKEGICSCKNCNEIFRIADFLDNDEAIRRTLKPINTKVKIIEDFEKVKIIVPAGGINGTAILLLLFSIVWNSVTWLFLVSSDADWWFKVIFVGAGIGVTVGFLMQAFLKHSIIFYQDDIKIVKDLLGLRYVKTKKVTTLEEITESVMYTQNYQPVYGVELQFNNQSNTKFGSTLNESERKWLIGELYEFRDKYVSKNNLRR